jgi:hypothetical protein
MANNDYILVKDKEGKMKYFKDGKYFEIDEIDNPSPSATTATPTMATVTPTVTVTVSPVDQKIETALTSVISDLKITFTDPTIEKKFRNLVASRLREVRGDKEVRYFLTVPKEEGGFGLDDKSAEAVLFIIKKYLEGLHSTPSVMEPPKLPTEKVIPPTHPVKPVAPPREADIITPATPPVAKISQKDLDEALNKLFAKPSEKPVEPDLVAPVPPVVTPVAPAPPVVTPVAPAPPVVTPVAPVPPVVHQVMKVESAKTLDEVKWTPKLVGPVEELGTMDIVNFRRLGATAEASLMSIREKITNLSNESWLRGVNGIRAWRNSPIYMVYASMGVEAILDNLPISQVIVNRQVKNLAVLTINEFVAINEFNHTLEM